MVFLTIALCFIIGHMQNDLIAPSFPDIKHFFNTDTYTFHISNSSYSLGVCVGGFFLGPLSDFFGRKKILCYGLILLIFSCVLCTLISNIKYLILLRFSQGIAASVPIMVCVALVFDLYTKNDSRRIIGTKNSILTFGKAIAPIIGTYINTKISWKANFLILASMSVLAIMLVYFNIKLKQKSKSNFKINRMLRVYRFLLSEPKIMIYTFILGLMACCLLTYTITAPIVYINFFKISKQLYGFHQSSVWSIFAIFSFLNHYMIKFFRLKLIKILGFLLIFSGVILLNIATYKTSVYLVTSSMMVCAAGFALLINTFFTEAMSLYNKFRGTISSFIAIFRALLVSISVATVGYFSDGTMKPITYIVSILSILIILMYYFLLKINKR